MKACRDMRETSILDIKVEIMQAHARVYKENIESELQEKIMVTIFCGQKISFQGYKPSMWELMDMNFTTTLYNIKVLIFS